MQRVITIGALGDVDDDDTSSDDGSDDGSYDDTSSAGGSDDGSYDTTSSSSTGYDLASTVLAALGAFAIGFLGVMLAKRI